MRTRTFPRWQASLIEAPESAVWAWLRGLAFASAVGIYLIWGMHCASAAQERLACEEPGRTLASLRNPAAVAGKFDPLKPEESNGDYLNRVVRPADDISLQSRIFHKEVSDEMKSRFVGYDAPFGAREHFNLNTNEQVREYNQQSKDLAEWTLKRLLQYHLENTLRASIEESVRRTANESKSTGERGAAKAIVAISSIQKAIQNTTLNLGEGMKTRFRYDFPSGTMRLGLTGPLLEANLDYSVRPQEQGIGAVSQPEKLSLGVSKNLELLKASTNFRYGMTGETINYGINKQVVGPLSAQVDQAHRLREQNRDETVVRLNFGTQF